jgi:hypothetical protein
MDPGSVAFYRIFPVAWGDADRSWVSASLRGHCELNDDGRLQLVWREASGGLGIHDFGTIVDSEWHRIEIVWDRSVNEFAGKLDDAAFTDRFPHFGTPDDPVGSFAIEGEGQDGRVLIDNYIVRHHHDAPPSVTLGPVEMAP